MSRVWNGRSFNEDWVEVDAMGNPLTGEKDWQANREYDATQPGGAWNFSQAVASANPVAWDQSPQGSRYWSAIRGGAPATPTTGQPGGPMSGGGSSGPFDWTGWTADGTGASPPRSSYASIQDELEALASGRDQQALMRILGR